MISPRRSTSGSSALLSPARGWRVRQCRSSGIARRSCRKLMAARRSVSWPMAGSGHCRGSIAGGTGSETGRNRARRSGPRGSSIQPVGLPGELNEDRLWRVGGEVGPSGQPVAPCPTNFGAEALPEKRSGTGKGPAHLDKGDSRGRCWASTEAVLQATINGALAQWHLHTMPSLSARRRWCRGVTRSARPRRPASISARR